MVSLLIYIVLCVPILVVFAIVNIWAIIQDDKKNYNRKPAVKRSHSSLKEGRTATPIRHAPVSRSVYSAADVEDSDISDEQDWMINQANLNEGNFDYYMEDERSFYDEDRLECLDIEDLEEILPDIGYDNEYFEDNLSYL